MRFSNEGWPTHCCKSEERLTDAEGDLSEISKNTFVDIMNGAKSKEIREALERGERHPNCKKCWEEEDAGIASKRILDNNMHPEFNGDTKVEPALLELNLGTTCNLKCRICGPWSSSKWNAEFYVVGDRNDETKQEYNEWLKTFSQSYEEDSEFTWKNIRDHIHIAKQIEIYGGEPFLVEKQWDILRECIEKGYSKNQKLHFNTNGTQYDDEKADIIRKFKECRISFSIDGLESHFEYQRHPAKWNEVRSNLDKFLKLSHENPHIILNVCITTNVHNVYYLPEILEYFIEMGMSPYVNFLHYQKFHNVRNINENIKLEIRKKLEQRIESNWHPEIKRLLQKVINFMCGATAEPGEWERFLTVTEKQDVYRTEKFSDTFPEFYGIIQKHV